MLIDGKWVKATGGAEYAVPNPATEEIIGKAPDASVADVERAIDLVNELRRLAEEIAVDGALAWPAPRSRAVAGH